MEQQREEFVKDMNEESVVVKVLLDALENLMESEGGEPQKHSDSDLQEQSDKVWQESYDAVARGHIYLAYVARSKGGA